MSDIAHWTDLPKGMKPDFVSYEGDYDFPFYLSEKEEWVNYGNTGKPKGKIKVSGPFLIMELNRFVPFLEGTYVKFHPLNMPYIKIGKIDIVGFVVAVSDDTRFYEYQIDDGTGFITVLFEKKYFEICSQERKKIDEKYEGYARRININLLRSEVCPKHFPTPRPQFNYPVGTSIRDMAILEHNWALETKNGLLGKKVKRNDYVHAIGYCSLDFMFGDKPQGEITFENLSNTKLNFLATKVTCINEWEYNAKLYSWLHTVVRRRYNENPDKPEILPKDEVPVES